MKALINPLKIDIVYTDFWSSEKPYKPIFAVLPDSCAVTEIAESEFDVAEPFFWVDCDDDVTSSNYYYDTKTKEILLIPNEKMPA